MSKASKAAKGVQLTKQTVLRLMVKSGPPKPTPEISRALGSLGLNVKDFVDRVGKATAQYQPNIPIPVIMTAFPNRTFTFYTKLPPTTYFIKKCAGIEKGSGDAKVIVGYINLKQVFAIAQLKKTEPHLSYLSLESLCSQIISTCKTMGVKVVNKNGQ